MTLKTDKRFIAAQSLKAILSYAIGIAIVLLFLNLEYPSEVVIASMLAGIIIFFLFFFPKEISVNNGTISFRKENSREKVNLDLAEIAEVETKCECYNTITLTTKSGKKYKLHPKDAQTLEQIVKSGK